jgi:hypothetical protein
LVIAPLFARFVCVFGISPSKTPPRVVQITPKTELLLLFGVSFLAKNGVFFRFVRSFSNLYARCTLEFSLKINVVRLYAVYARFFVFYKIKFSFFIFPFFIFLFHDARIL